MIEIKNLSKKYKDGKNSDFFALQDIDFEIASNECVILKGASGSGKSTLLSIIGAMSKPSNGAVLIDGVNFAKVSDDAASSFRHKKIGYIFQFFNLIEELSVYENIASPLHLCDYSQELKSKMIKEAKKLASFDKSDFSLTKDLSGGEKQRCAIARALVNNPEIILADEPTANLDGENSRNFVETIRLLKQLGKTIVIATHDPVFDDLEFVDKIINLKYGKIV